MKRLLSILSVGCMAIVLSGCGERVEVPPAYVGKVLTSEGYREGNIPPSKFRLPVCLTLCDKLVVLEASDYPVQETMKLFMPKDQLNMAFDVRATLRIENTDSVVDSIFDRIPSQQTKSSMNHGVISFDRVYKTYGIQKFRSITRQVMANYTINEIATNRQRIEKELFDRLAKAMQETPIKVMTVALADVQFPQVIVEAKELAKEREVAIEKAEAEKQIALAKAQAELELAEKDRAVRLTKAQTIKEENELVAKSVTPQYLAYRRLEVMEALGGNTNAVFFPTEMMDNIGLQNRVFGR